MYSIKKIAPVFLISFITVLQSCSSSKSIELSFNPQAGSTYKYVTTTDQTTSQEAMGQKMESKNHMEMYATYAVANNKDNDRELNVTYDRIVMKQSAMGMEVSVDTDVTDTTTTTGSMQTTKMFQNMKGQPFSIVLTKDGNIKEVKGFSSIMDKMMNATGNESSQEVKQSMKALLGEDFIKSMFTQAFKIFPDKKVGVNDIWKTKMEIKSLLGLALENSYTLKSFDDKKAVLDVQSTITTNGDMDMMGMKIKGDLKGKSNGIIEVERNTGMVLNSNIKQTIAGEMEVMNMKVPISIDQTVKIEAKPLK